MALSYPHMVSSIIAMWMILNYLSPSPLLTPRWRHALCVPCRYLNLDVAHHLKHNLDKTELLILPGKAWLIKDLSITVDNSTVLPSQSAKNLGVTLDNTLSFSANIKAVTLSCRFMLYNICRF